MPPACIASHTIICRTPQGVRGLKFSRRIRAINCGMSHPARGAWIEIEMNTDQMAKCMVAPRKGCVD